MQVDQPASLEPPKRFGETVHRPRHPRLTVPVGLDMAADEVIRQAW